jgi:DNA (cytosine-5)-methyltransferase 1
VAHRRIVRGAGEADRAWTLGSLFAGIGGFDLGFERAGWHTRWQVEIDPVCRAVLTDRFPAAQRFEDVRHVGTHNLARVDCITAGFPCQDISTSGARRKDKSHQGLRGARSGLFYEVIRLLRELQPTWVVLENVAALLYSNDSEDIERVIQELAECGYLGFWRVLDAQHWGVPQRRRRIFVVGGLGRYPSFEYLGDAGSVVGLPSSGGQTPWVRPADAWAGYTLQACNTTSRITLGCELFVAEEGRWHSMVERSRASQVHGLCRGLDEANFAEARAAGNAVCPQVAEWIARKLIRS